MMDVEFCNYHKHMYTDWCLDCQKEYLEGKNKNMKVIIQTIPHGGQRYPTVGDWEWTDRNTLQIRVSRMSNWKYEAAVAIHELVEALWCKAAGVDEQVVTDFDLQHTNHDVEPGDCSEAPYHEGHQLATKLEKLLMDALAWAEYDREVVNL